MTQYDIKYIGGNKFPFKMSWPVTTWCPDQKRLILILPHSLGRGPARLLLSERWWWISRPLLQTKIQCANHIWSTGMCANNFIFYELAFTFRRFSWSCSMTLILRSVSSSFFSSCKRLCMFAAAVRAFLNTERTNRLVIMCTVDVFAPCGYYEILNIRFWTCFYP